MVIIDANCLQNELNIFPFQNQNAYISYGEIENIRIAHAHYAECAS